MSKKEILSYIIIILVVILLRTFIITPVRVNGDSMYPTLLDKEIMILSKIDYVFNDIERFDIVVIKYNDEYLIKRVIALPNEVLEYKDNLLYINNKVIKESFERLDTNDFNIEDLGYSKVPDNCYIVMGDNRKDSLDSRVFGCINKDDILGSANIVLYPFSKFGFRK